MKHLIAISVLIFLLSSCAKEVDPCHTFSYDRNSVKLTYQSSTANYFLAGPNQDTGSYIKFYYHDTAVIYWSTGSAYASSNSYGDMNKWQINATYFTANEIDGRHSPAYAIDSAFVYLRYIKSENLTTQKVCAASVDTFHFKF